MDYKAISENGKEYVINFNDNSHGKINGEDFNLDVMQQSANHFHTIYKNKSYNIELVKADYEEKQFTLKVNDTIHTFNVKDKYDELLKSLGLENLNAAKVNE